MRIPFTNIYIERRSLANPISWLAEALGGNKAASGVNVTPSTALQSTAVFACVRVLAETVASLPLPVYRRLPGGGKERAIGHYLYSILHDLPNPELTSFEFREALMGHLALWGNAYAEIERDNGGRVRALWPLRPDRMQVYREQGELRYKYQLPDGSYVVLKPIQVMHIRGLSGDGIVGYSPIRLAREAIGLALATEEFGARFFSNGAHPGGIIEYPGTLKEEAYQRFKQSVQEAYGGLSKSHRLMILEQGLKYHQVGIPPEDSQYLETRKFQVNEIARIFRIPPHMIGDLERATFSNIEHQSIEFVVHTIRPWLVRWEQAIKRDLFLPGERNSYFAEFLVDGLLRGDIKSRYEAYAIGRQNGWLSADDIRELENMNPLPDGQGKIYLVNGNMLPTDMVGKQQAARSIPQLDERRSIPETRAANIRRGIANSYKRVIADAVARVLKREEADIMRQARKVLGNRDLNLFDAWLSDFYREHEEFIRRTMEPAFVGYAEAVQAAAAEEVGGQAKMNQELRKFVDEYMANYIWRHSGVSITELRDALEQAVTEGRDQLEVLQETFDMWRETRPQEAAQEETIRMGGAVALLTWASYGVTKVRWVASGTSCPLCRQLDGKVVDINTPFVTARGKGDKKHPPLHKGCDCYIAAENRITGSTEETPAQNIIHRENSVGVKEKLVQYSLNPEKSKDKAVAFEKALGYNLSNHMELVEKIYESLPKFPAVLKKSDEYGDRYQVLMDITGPNGKTAKVMTAWIVDKTGIARLVSAYVKRRRK